MALRNSAALAALALAACGAGEAKTEAEPERAPLGLFTTLPIYWQENADFASMLSEEGEPGWVRSALEESYRVEPLDVLDETALASVRQLVLAQPRALSGAENVALDNWVRGGGQLLLFADPMLTGHSQFAIGDPRRPQDVVLLSPILARWGLELTFDEQQAEGERLVVMLETAIPVHLAGTFQTRESEKGARCSLSGSGILAQCTLGNGRVTLLADAAVLDDGPAHDDHSHEAEQGHAQDARRTAFGALVDAAFDRR